MGKANRATRKELETVVGQMIHRIKSLEFVVAKYMKFKNDDTRFNKYLKDLLKEGKTEIEEKQRRGRIQQPL